MDPFDQRIRLATRAAQRGALVNAFLVIVKIVTGVLGNSYALIADGIESGSDVLSSLIVWRGLAISKRGPSEKYHFGYGRAETVAGLLVALMLLTAGVGILIAAVREVLTPQHLPELFTLPILLIVIAVKEVLFRTVTRVSDETESSALETDAWHHRSDAITSAAAFIGISIAIVGGPGWESADDYAAIICAFVIGYTAVNLLKKSLAELMDRAPSRELVDRIRSAATAVQGVKLIEKIFARKSGLTYFVDLHVHADPGMSLHDAHILSGKVKTAVRNAIPAVRGVMVHMEPWQEHGTGDSPAESPA